TQTSACRRRRIPRPTASSNSPLSSLKTAMRRRTIIPAYLAKSLYKERHEDQRLPPDAASRAAGRFRDALRIRVGDAAVVGAGRRPAGRPVLQLDAGRAAVRGQ